MVKRRLHILGQATERFYVNQVFYLQCTKGRLAVSDFFFVPGGFFFLSSPDFFF